MLNSLTEIHRAFLLVLLTGVMACQADEYPFDASGVFESTEIVISSEVNGVIRSFPAVEGSRLDAGEAVVRIDVTDLALEKEQVDARIASVQDKRNEAGPQIAVLQQQLTAAEAAIAALETEREVLVKEQDRIHRLHAGNAATEQQRDEIDGKVQVLDQRIRAAGAEREVIAAQIQSARQSVAIQNRGITSETGPLEKQKEQLEDKLNKGTVINPVAGTLLSKYAFFGEFVRVGTPLYRLANLDTMELRAYLGGGQLSAVRLGQQVDVFVDDGPDSYHRLPGTVTWISEQAEFTPKSIQTKDERARLVYAIKIRVANDGRIKIGMYGEVRFESGKEPS
ncbi:MAG: HlyD family efflux transporter periplasmic adaptor subunit [Saprospiraceae bacterium]|nr:HlyD family efflux transporter periplasmic adaptor subunit [Saprospiraceae bacterium]